jgi:hypothetical protein
VIRHISRFLLVSLVSTLIVACAQSPEEAAECEARDDLRCDDVTVIPVQVEESVRGCPPMILTAVGCGRTADYSCRAGIRDCDYRCRRTR